jgi:hypothetical protein
MLDMIPHGPYMTEPSQWRLCDPKRPTTIVPGGPGRRRWEALRHRFDDVVSRLHLVREPAAAAA